MNGVQELLIHMVDGAYIIDDQRRTMFWNEA